MRSALAGLLLTASAWSAQPDYFPLQPGNQWIYRQTGFAASGDVVVAEIARTEVMNGVSYSLLQGLEGQGGVWLRMDEQGTLFAYDPVSQRETVWAEFATPEGGTYRTAVNPCNQTAVVRSRNAEVKVPAGDFSGAMQVNYPAANCADAGLTMDHFLPYIGLVRRESLTIGGPRALELIYARVGGVTVLSEPEVSFALTLDKSAYGHPRDVPAMTARLTLRVTLAEPLELLFPTGQRFDLVIRNEAGEEVLRWSKGKGFTQALGRERIGPGEKNYAIRLDLAAEPGRPLPPGRYTAEGYLTNTDGKRYASAVAFDMLALR